MYTLSEQTQRVLGGEPKTVTLDPRSQIKQTLREQIREALDAAQRLPPSACRQEIKTRLLAIQTYCKTVGKTFIMVEESITCAQYSLGGGDREGATLFRGPSQDASVAICVTDKGSLLHRNDHAWKIYRDAGDIAPIECLT